jgi:NADH:ubiquinone oxidoreductase subunit E
MLHPSNTMLHIWLNNIRIQVQKSYSEDSRARAVIDVLHRIQVQKSYSEDSRARAVIDVLHRIQVHKSYSEDSRARAVIDVLHRIQVHKSYSEDSRARAVIDLLHRIQVQKSYSEDSRARAVIDVLQSTFTGFVTRLTRQMPLLEQELLTLLEHLSSSPVFSGVCFTRSLVLYVCFVDRLSFVLFLMAIVLSVLLQLQILITSLVSSNSSYPGFKSLLWCESIWCV